MTSENDLIRRGDAKSEVLAAMWARSQNEFQRRLDAIPAAPLEAPKHLTDALDAALKGYTPGVDRAVRWVSIDQVDMLAEFYLNQRKDRG